MIIGEGFNDFSLDDIYEFLDTKGTTDPVLTKTAVNAITTQVAKSVASTLPDGSVAKAVVDNAKILDPTKGSITTGKIKFKKLIKVDDNLNKLQLNIHLDSPLTIHEKKLLVELLAPLIAHNFVAKTLHATETSVVVNNKNTDVKVTVFVPSLKDTKLVNEMTKEIKHLVTHTVDILKNNHKCQKTGISLMGAILIIGLVLGLNHKFNWSKIKLPF
jgi:hypothetical protein